MPGRRSRRFSDIGEDRPAHATGDEVTVDGASGVVTL